MDFFLRSQNAGQSVIENQGFLQNRDIKSHGGQGKTHMDVLAESVRLRIVGVAAHKVDQGMMLHHAALGASGGARGVENVAQILGPDDNGRIVGFL